MKTIIQNLIIAFIIISILLSLPFILKKREFKTYTDEELRKTAISKGLKAVPNSYEELIKLYKNETITKQNIALGKELFFDTKLSKNNDISCSTCHLLSKNKEEKKVILNALTKDKKPNDMKNANDCIICHLGDESGTDRLSTSIGSNGKTNPYHLNTMTILNSSLAKFLTWSAEAKTLEIAIKKAIKAPHQMNMGKEALVLKLQKDSKYKEFNLSFEQLQKALATYIRTLLTRGDFDKFLEGDNKAINEKAKQGLANFMNFGCAGCHTGMSVGGQSAKRFPLRHFARIHDLRPNLNSNLKIVDNSFPFENKGGFKGRANTHFFRVPILRNITTTSPYFHNGSVDKIYKAVKIMGQHQLGLNLSNNQIEQIVEFLKTLKGEVVDYTSKRSLK